MLNGKNLGHRLGGDVYPYENTLSCYKKSLKILQYKKDFHYVEFDIRETKDNKIVVFHDSKIARVVPKSKYNIKVLKRVLKKKRFDKIRIKDLTSEEISKLVIAKNVHIPTLEDILKSSIKWGLTKPMHIELKSLHTDTARYKLIELIKKYHKKIDISIIAFRKYFYQSFPFPPRWIKLLKDNNINAYQIDKYSFTNDISTSLVSGNFTTLLSESRFSISKKTGRVKSFTFVIPKEIKCGDSLKIGISGGLDNTGDRGVTFNVTNENGKELISGFSNTKGWEWFTLNPRNSRKFILTIEDRDTNFSGKYPGNDGMVKVLYMMN